MARQKYYDFTKIFGEEMEELLLMLKSLISTKKITDNLPNDVNSEIDNLNEKMDSIENSELDVIDGGWYSTE